MVRPPAGKAPRTKKEVPIPKRIRNIKRLLAKESLPADVRIAQERILAALEAKRDAESHERTLSEVERNHQAKYRKIKFFELQKLRRVVKKATGSDLEAAHDKIAYVDNFPRAIRYISIIKPDAELDAGTLAQRNAILDAVRVARQNGSDLMAAAAGAVIDVSRLPAPLKRVVKAAGSSVGGALIKGKTPPHVEGRRQGKGKDDAIRSPTTQPHSEETMSKKKKTSSKRKKDDTDGDGHDRLETSDVKVPHSAMGHDAFFTDAPKDKAPLTTEVEGEPTVKRAKKKKSKESRKEKTSKK
eukprot:m.98325 g.98325  ORF g.98325 m.98325 type:complete len:299 (+) comp10253_c1_seq2:342-1238(+)